MLSFRAAPMPGNKKSHNPDSGRGSGFVLSGVDLNPLPAAFAADPTTLTAGLGSDSLGRHVAHDLPRVNPEMSIRENRGAFSRERRGKVDFPLRLW